MLTSLVLTLEAPAPALVPRHLGRASHALLLRLIGEREAGLSAELHDSSGPRPFTCSDLLGARGVGAARQLSPEQPLWLRYTGLSEAVSQHLLALAAAPPESVDLDGQRLKITGATLDPARHPWAGMESYRSLCDRHLHAPGPPTRRLEMVHASPTTFRSQGTNIPLPLPYLVFGSLLGRWQALAPVAVSPDTRRYVQEMVVLSRYRLRTRSVQLEGGALQMGFVGQSGYALLNADRYWANALSLLTAYSFYAGLGAHTTMGMGQTRPLARAQAPQQGSSWARSG